MAYEFVSLRYFQRVWIIQEAVLARTLYLLMNDDELLISWSIIDRLSFIVGLHEHQLPGVLRVRQKAGLTLSVDIVACLRAGFNCQCTDARDKVFAVLSLMETPIRSLIPVDYSLDVASVYASALIAIVASRGNLDILSYASCFSRSSPVWPSHPAIALNKLELFLNAKEQERRVFHPRQGLVVFLPSQFDGDAIGPWRANIQICTVDDMADIPLPSVSPGHTRVTFCRTPHDPRERNIMPRFRIRAHFIDKVVCNFFCITGPVQRISIADIEGHSAIRFGDAVCHSPNLLGEEYHSFLPFFRKSKITQSKYSSPSCQEHEVRQEDEVRRDEICDCNWEDLIAFASVAKARGKYKSIFLAENSIGFASWSFQSDDEIWAIDGARVPFILRKTGPNTYRIVTECYLWAALELDYWNPGTKKGRWSENRPAHNEQQTHVIEIH
jgi:hypothetical protein